MTRRRSLVVFAAAAALLVLLNAVMYELYGREAQTVDAALDDRLTALGTTTARWLTLDTRDASAMLRALAGENRLDDAYLLDGGMQVVAGARTPPGVPLNLLRVDTDRLAAALDGRASVGDGYSIANKRVETAYFPVPGTGRVLALEAGAEYHAPAAGLRTTYLEAVGLSLLVASVFGVALAFALRSLERVRLAHGRAERLAAVGQMAAMVAHEVRNPLGILRGQVELARERLAADASPRERERFAEMLDEIERLNRLTEQFLGLARDLPLDLASVDLAVLVDEVIADTRVAFGDAKVSAAAPVAGTTVVADAGKLRQALRNLVLNAVEIGGAGVEVHIEVTAQDGQTRLSVSDNGPGIPAAIAATLFEPFVTARPGGSGLGLTVARRVVELHGGTLVVDSPPDARGARFSIYLPREQ